jgi:hypothetical protein
MGESLFEKLKRAAAEYENTKHDVTLSIVKLQPGLLLLGPSRSTNRVMIGIELVLLAISVTIYMSEKSIGSALPVFVFALFLEWMRSKMRGEWFRIDGRNITGRWRKVANHPLVEIDYVESHLAIDIHTWEVKDDKTSRMESRGAVRIRTSPLAVPNILIAESQVRGLQLAAGAEAILLRLREHLQPEE